VLNRVLELELRNYQWLRWTVFVANVIHGLVKLARRMQMARAFICHRRRRILDFADKSDK